jgi:general transcription factor 3C polypeptide 3 (transcription factor C subunit 4)
VLRELGPLLVDEGSGAKASELYMAAFDYYRANFSYTNQPDQDEEDTLFGVEDLLALVDYLSFQYRWAEMITSIRVGVRWIQGREMQRAWDSLDDDREYDMARKSRVAIPNGKSFEAAAVYPLDDRLRVKLGVARMGLNDMVEAKVGRPLS